MTRILITNEGAHPPETWAMVTAERIFDISGSVAGDRLIQAQKFRLALAEALVPLHDEVQCAERERLDNDASSINGGYDIATHLDKIIETVVALSKDTPYEDHFAKPEVQDAARQVIASDILSQQHLERLLHADRNPDCEESKTYSLRFKGA